MKNTKIWFPLVTLTVSLLWIAVGLTEYRLWDGIRGPGAGFFPVIIAFILAAVSVIALVKSFKEEAPVYDRDALKVLGGMAFVLIAYRIIGFLPALLVFLIGWLRLVEKFPLKTVVKTTVVMSAMIYGVFVLWLRVPFPYGVIVDYFRLR